MPHFDALPDRKRKAVEEAKRLFESGQGQCWSRRDQMLEWTMAYHGVVTHVHQAQRSQVPHDITREAIERIIPKLLGSNIGFEYFRDGQFADAPSTLARFYLDKMRYVITAERTARDKLTLGRGIRKWCWRNEARHRKRPLTEAEIRAFQSIGYTEFPRKVSETLTVYDGPFCFGVDPFAMTYDTSTDDPHRQYFTFEEFHLSPQAMRQEADLENFDAGSVEDLIREESKTPLPMDQWRNEAIARIGIDQGIAHTVGSPTAYGLIEGYFPFDLDGDGRDEPILIVTDPGFLHILRLEENPYDHGMPPYVYDDWVRVTGEFWPIGVAEMLEPVQTMINVWSNLGIDNIVLSVFNVWLKHRDARIPQNSLKVVPNLVIPTDMMNGLQPLRPNDHSGNILTMLQYYLKRAQEQSGITQFSALGTPELGQTKTALGIQTLKAAAEEFLAYHRRTMLMDAMARDAELFLANLQQFMDAPLDIAIRGEDGRMQPFRAMPDDVIGQFDWNAIVENQNPLSRELESQAFENWIAMGLKMRVPVNATAAWLELGKRRQIGQPERYILRPQAPPQLQGQSIMAQQAALGAGNRPTFPSLEGGPQPAEGAPSALAGVTG